MTALIFGLDPLSKGCVVKSRVKSPSPGIFNELTSNCMNGLVTGRNPTADLRSLNPSTLISTVTGIVSGLNISYIKLYSGISPGLCIVKDSKISPDGIFDLPDVSVYHLGIGTTLGLNFTFSI